MSLIGSNAPRYECKAVVDGRLAQLSWEQLQEGKWLVLMFYPLDFTFVCPTEIIAYSEAADRFAALDAKVAAVSVDSVYTHLAWVNTPRNEGGLGEISIPLLSDLDRSIAKAYDVLLDEGVALRALFLIDPNGVVRHATINDLPVGRNVDETLRVVEAFQFHEAHGDVCPANWTPGQPTLVPEPAEARSYFRAAHGDVPPQPRRPSPRRHRGQTACDALSPAGG